MAVEAYVSLCGHQAVVDVQCSNQVADSVLEAAALNSDRNRAFNDNMSRQPPKTAFVGIEVRIEVILHRDSAARRFDSSASAVDDRTPFRVFRVLGLRTPTISPNLAFVMNGAPSEAIKRLWSLEKLMLR